MKYRAYYKWKKDELFQLWTGGNGAISKINDEPDINEWFRFVNNLGHTSVNMTEYEWEVREEA